MNKISQFSGDYGWLSNFWPAKVEFEGEMYPSSEHAFQAAKTIDLEERRQIKLASTAILAKRMGRNVTLRPNWENIKTEIMSIILIDKFTRHSDLKQKLLDTGDAYLEEGNYWGDTFWGVCKGTGTNHLGKILMRIRGELNNESRNK